MHRPPVSAALAQPVQRWLMTTKLRRQISPRSMSCAIWSAALDRRAAKGEALDGWIPDWPTATAIRQPCERFSAENRGRRGDRAASDKAA